MTDEGSHLRLLMPQRGGFPSETKLYLLENWHVFLLLGILKHLHLGTHVGLKFQEWTILAERRSSFYLLIY